MTPETAKRIDVLGILVALVGLAWNMWKSRHFFHDDAYISLRYASNLVDHGQLTWNLGEFHEGYTNFLFVLMSAGLLSVGFPPEAAVRLLNLGAAFVLIGVLAVAARRLMPAPEDAPIRAMTLAMLGLSPSFGVWVLGGLETVVVAAFLALGCLALLPQPAQGHSRKALLLSTIAFSLGVLTRLDVSVFVAGIGFGLLIAGSGPFLRRATAAATVVLIPAATAFLHMGWRIWYYGELLPLTFYAKMGVDDAVRLKYIPEFVRLALFANLCIVTSAIIALISLGSRRRSPEFLIMLPAIALQMAFVVYSGADHMPHGRVVVPLLAPSLMMMLATLNGLGPRLRLALPTTAATLVLLAAVSLAPRYRDPAAFLGRSVGRYIKANWPDNSLIALHTAGSTPFFATRNVYIDMLGLNDPIIAHRDNITVRAPGQYAPGHSKGDGGYVLSRRPDFVILGPSLGTTAAAPLFLSDVEISEVPGFAECYRIENVDVPHGTGAHQLPLRTGPDRFTYYRRICP